MDWLPRRARKRIFFTPISPFSVQIFFFACKTAYAIFKVVYQASHIPKIRKFMVWLPRNAKKCIFFTPFSPFLAKKILFSKIRLHHFFGTIKSYLDTKNQKKLWGRSSGIYSDGRTDGRTDECKSIVPPKFLGRSKKNYFNIIDNKHSIGEFTFQ